MLGLISAIRPAEPRIRARHRMRQGPSKGWFTGIRTNSTEHRFFTASRIRLSHEPTSSTAKLTKTRMPVTEASAIEEWGRAAGRINHRFRCPGRRLRSIFVAKEAQKADYGSYYLAQLGNVGGEISVYSAGKG